MNQSSFIYNANLHEQNPLASCLPVEQPSKRPLRMKKTILILISVIFCISTYSQSRNSDVKAHHFDFGLGAGYEYGGVGFQASYAPIPYASVFAGVGFNGGLGYNFGAVWHILPKTTRYMFRPYIEVMYGYNLVFVYTDESFSTYDVEQYYGPSAGAGCEVRFGKKKRHGVDLCAFRYAFWTSKARDVYNNASSDMKPPMGPIGFSIGYHIEF